MEHEGHRMNFGLAKIFNHEELKEATNNFDSSRVLGSGGFGKVYLGKLNGKMVAVKKLFDNNPSLVEQFLNEVSVLSRIRHQNLVTLHGCTNPRSQDLLLVYDFVPNGTVAEHLHCQESTLTWDMRIQIAVQTAQVLAYLHALEPPVIHRDVKTSNILLDDAFHAKVADFGICRLMPWDSNHITTLPQGTMGYRDPEYDRTMRLTDKSDVYSFGVVLLELMSGMQAVDVYRGLDNIYLDVMALRMIKGNKLKELVDSKLNYRSDTDTRRMINSVAELACECLCPKGKMRPTMLQVLKALTDIQDKRYKIDDKNVDGAHLGLPPIAQNEPILFLIREQIATLTKGSLDARADAAASLCSLARDNERHGKFIIEEDGVTPLLRLIKEGKVEGQEAAAKAVGLLARDQESVEQMVHFGVCSAFAKALKDAPMSVQSMVAWAVSELAANHPGCQDLFALNNVIRLLVGHLAFETVQEHSKYTIQPKVTSIHIKGREFEDAATKAYMKAMSARALSQLAKGNPATCKSITESRALLCFAVLLEKGAEDVQYNSALALMEIARVAEQDADLRRSAFKPNSPAARAVVDQLIRIVEKADYDDLLVPCIVSLGCLSRTFRATETRIIGPLVKLLDETERDAIISREAAVALGKFACTENYLHPHHSKAIIDAGGAKHLVQLVDFGESMVQIPSLVLLCYIAYHVPDSEALTQAEVLTVLEWALKQAYMVQDPAVDTLLPKTKVRLELYQSRGSRGYH